MPGIIGTEIYSILFPGGGGFLLSGSLHFLSSPIPACPSLLRHYILRIKSKMKTGYSAGSKNRSVLLCSSKKDLLWSQVTDLSFPSIMGLSGRAVLYYMVNLPVVRNIADMSYEHTQDSLETWNVCLRSLMINYILLYNYIIIYYI